MAHRTLVLIRHGQTDWNVEERFQGQLDIPLNAVGYSQAEALNRQFAEMQFDTAYSSPLRRAIETARIIAGSRIQSDPRLTEIHHGSWQGKTKQEIAEQWPDQWEEWTKDPLSFTAPGGESPESLRTRIRDFLSTLEGTNILCVSHGAVIQMFLSILEGGSYGANTPVNGSVHTFEI
jgi:broad specificity phosphatase PhoE